MTTSIVQPGTFTDSTYKRSDPRIVHTDIIELSREERRAKGRGRRRCSCFGVYLTDVARRCVNIAAACNAKSWSVYPMPGQDAVYVQFHNWPETGLCNFQEPVKRTKNYWWDVRPVPHWMAPEDKGAMKDTDGHFDPEA